MTTTRSLGLGAPAAASSVETPTWFVLAFGAIGLMMFAAITAGGEWPLTAVVFLCIIGAFLLVLRYPHVGISLFLTTFLINYPGVARGTGYLTINNVLGLTFLSMLTWDYYRQRDASYVWDRLIVTLLVIGGIFVVGTIAAEYTLPDSHIQRLIRKTLGSTYSKTDYTERFMFQYFSRVAFVVFIVKFIRTPRQLLWVFGTLIGCILFAVPFAISTYVTAETTDVRALTRVVNWADNANRFAFGLLIGGTFLYYLALTARSTIGKVSAGAVAIVLVPVVLLSASRSGFMGLLVVGVLVVGGAFGGASGPTRRGGIGGLLVLVGVALITYFTILPPRMQERILNINPFAEETAEGSQSTEFRTATLQNSFDIIGEHPMLGVGLGNFRWVHKLTHGRYKPPHNSYVWALAEGGLLLFAAYAVLFVTLWRRIGRLREAYADHASLPRLPQWLRIYILLLLFFSFFADVWIEVHLFLLVGATILMDRWRTASSEPASALAPVGVRG